MGRVGANLRRVEGGKKAFAAIHVDAKSRFLSLVRFSVGTGLGVGLKVLFILNWR